MVQTTSSHDGLASILELQANPATTKEELASEIKVSEIEDGYSSDATMIRRMAANRVIDREVEKAAITKLEGSCQMFSRILQINLHH